jgi:organic radical activating enzyme
VDPARFEALAFDHFFLQPMDGPLRADNTARAIAYCQKHPRWKLGIQSHKMIGIR